MTPTATDHRLELLVGGTETYGRMWHLIGQAREAIDLETYIFRQGAVGDRFVALLSTAAARGVRVRLLVDALGSDELPDGYFDGLVAAGAELRWFNPKRLLHLSFRNHRKLLRCDRTAVVGGLNIGDEYDGDGIERGWRDFAVAIEGPVVGALGASFARMWELAAFGRNEIREFWAQRQRPATGSGETIELLVSGPGCRTAELRRRLVRDLREARSFFGWTSYFVPSRRVGAAIREAGRRGAARLLLGARSDVPLSRWASEHLLPRYLRAGVELSYYRPQVVHAKVLVANDVVYVGSSNLDVRSLLINYELALRIPSVELAARLRAEFQDDLGRAERIDRRQWRTGRRWWQRLRSQVAYLLVARLDPYIANRRLRSLR
jgi:cardiolipin synthase A/B